MGYELFEYRSTGGDQLYGPASDEDVDAYTKALQAGQAFFTKGHHGFELKFYVRKKNSSDR